MGDSLVPTFWTDYFGVKPDTAIVKGEYFVTPSGRTSSMPGWSGLWGVRSETFVLSDTLEPHLRYLTHHLNLTRPGLRELLEGERLKARFWCYWRNETGDRVADVPNDIRTMMESLGGVIEIDEYR